MKKGKSGDKIVSIRMKRADYMMLGEDAKKQKRSVSNMFIWLWTQWRNNRKRK